jgi:hypothetical protein
LDFIHLGHAVTPLFGIQDLPDLGSSSYHNIETRVEGALEGDGEQEDIAVKERLR